MAMESDIREPEKSPPVTENAHNDDGSEMDKKKSSKRVVWASKVEYMLTCIGYCVGLGNIWRFPYLCYKNGGGAFLLPYTLMAVFCGLPLVALEQVMGQYVGLGVLPFWNICPMFKGIGVSCCILNLLLAVYYILVIVYAIYYVFSSFAYEVPWKHCGHEWNTDACSEMYPTHGDNETEIWNNVSSSLVSQNGTNITYISPAEEFFENSVLEKTSGIHDLGGIRWPLFVCLLIAWTMVFLATVKGIRSGGKVAYVTATVPYVMLTILVVRGAMLPGSVIGIKYYLIPQWDKLLDAQVWFSAALQITYSLGTCYGIFITMSSYNNFHNNPLRDSVITVSINCLTSFYAGFAVFSVLGAMAYQLGVTVEDVVASGPGLAFIAYPEALAAMPLSQVWSVLFFGMLVLLGLSSEVCHFETFLSALADQYPVIRRPRYRAVLGACMAVLFFCAGIVLVTQGGMYVFFLVDWYGMAFSLMVIAVLEAIVFCWIYGYSQVSDNVVEMIGHRPNLFFRLCWQFLLPLAFVVILAMSIATWKPATLGSYEYPTVANAVGWVLAMSSMIPIPVVAVLTVIRAEGETFSEKLHNSLSPNNLFHKQIKERRTAAERSEQYGSDGFELLENKDAFTYAAHT